MPLADNMQLTDFHQSLPPSILNVGTCSWKRRPTEQYFRTVGSDICL